MNIQYKAKDINKIWRFGTLSKKIKDGKIQYYIQEEIIINDKVYLNEYEILDKKYICQWTGNYDGTRTEENPKGKKIYENDRVEVQRDNSRNFIVEKAVIKRLNNDTTAGFIMQPEEDWSFTTWSELRVIGNILD